MADTEILFPPAIQVQDEGLTVVDDMTDAFRPAFARGGLQVQVYGGPRLKMTRRVLVRQTELGKALAFLQNMRGKGRRFYASPNYVTRGSFSDAELITNNTFANGITGFSAYNAAVGAIAAQERHVRVTRVKNANYAGVYQTPNVTQYACYSGRGFIYPGKGAASSQYTMQLYDTVLATGVTNGLAVGGYLSGSLCALGSTIRHLLYDAATSGGQVAGDLFEVPWMSLSRCLQVDGGANLFLYSDQFDNAAWALGNATISANTVAAPDGTTTADGLRETAVSATHDVRQTATVTTSSLDYTASFCLQAGTRTWAAVFLQENATNGNVGVYFDLANGVIGNTVTGSNWQNIRSAMVPLGNGWYRCCVTALKTNSATGVMARVYSATANGTNSYLGVAGSDALRVWRGGLNQGSFAYQPVQTTSAANAAPSITGNSINVKGGPASQAGLLLEGDIVEIDGQVYFLTASLDTDAAGCGWLAFGPSFVTSPTDGDAVIANYPLGKFMQASDPQITNMFGQYGEISFDMEQVYT